MSLESSGASTFGTNLDPHPALEFVGRVLWEGATGVAALARWLRKAAGNRKEFRRLRREYGTDGGVICKLLEERKLKDSTLRAYIRQIRFFNRWLVANPRPDIDPVTVEEYLALRPASTRSMALCALRALYDGALDLGATTGLLHAAKPRRPKRATVGETAEIAAAATRLPDMLLVLVANVFGLRPAQARELKWKHLRLSGEVLTLAEEHSVTRASAKLGETALRKVQGALLGNDPDEAVFLNTDTGKPFTVRTLNLRIGRLAQHTTRKDCTYTDLRLARGRLSAETTEKLRGKPGKDCSELLVDASYPPLKPLPPRRIPGVKSRRASTRRQPILKLTRHPSAERTQRM